MTQVNNFLDAVENAKMYEGFGNLVGKAAQGIGKAAQNFGDKAVAKSQVKHQAAQDQAAANTQALEPILKQLQQIANAQTNFDAASIESLMKSINELNLDNGVKKQINQILNQQKQSLGKDDNSTQGEKPQNDTGTDTPQGDTNNQAPAADGAVKPNNQNNTENVQSTEQSPTNDPNTAAAQGGKPAGTDGEVQKIENRIDSAGLDQAIQGLNQFSKYKPIKAVIDEYNKFKQSLEQTKQQ